MRPRLTVDALDALITAGQDAPGPDLEARVIDQLGRMLRARVLMHRAGGRYLQLEAQDVHTLSSWTVLRLARTRRIRAHRIRPRPEYWRPDQRRPGGVLAFPIGTGVAALARKVPFAEKEIQAVRTVLRFLASRRPPSPTDSHAVRRQRTHTTMPESRVKGLVGSSRAWSRVLQQVWRIAPSGCSVLLRGETGTGKELIGRAIHYGSPRAGAPFVAINCAALNPETFLAELFGHIRGAFTGADRSRDGIVRSAHRGTLFLDELGDMPIPMQVALLRLLEDRLVRPVGSARTHRVDVRIVSATNRNLESLMRSGHFRQDLYHRLNVMEIDLPPLRSRIEDLPELAEHLLARTPHAASLHMDALSALAEHHWPGNVRELDNVLQAAALLSDGDVVTPEVVRGILAGRRTPPAPASPRLPPRAERILELLGTQWRSAPALAAALMVSTRTVNRDLQSLLRAGLVERSGDARASRYRRAGSVWRDVAGFARN